MPRVILLLLTVALTVYALVDCVGTEERRVRTLPKLLWVLVIVFLPWLGPLAWLVAGREKSSPRSTSQPHPQGRTWSMRAPDDDPEFLARLARENRERARPRQQEEPPPPRGSVDDPTGDRDDPDSDDGARK